MFDQYPIITYDNKKMIDISKRFAITNIESETSQNIYFYHTIQGWKSPENIAYDYYGSCDYVWVILTLNNIINPFDDWLHTDEEMNFLIKQKYGNKMYEPHHYEINGISYRKLPENVNGATVRTVTNYEYEMEQNEKKRTIKILYPHLLSTIEHEVRAMFT